MQPEQLPPFAAQRLEQLRRQSAHSRADAALAREANDEALRRLYAAENAARNLANPEGFQSVEEREAARLRFADLHAKVAAAKAACLEAERSVHQAHATAKRSANALTQASSFLEGLAPGTLLQDARSQIPVRPLVDVQSDIANLRGQLSSLRMRPRPEQELRQAAFAFVSAQASALNPTVRLHPETDQLTVLFQGDITSKPSPLPFIAALFPEKLTDFFTSQLRLSQRGTIGDPISKSDRTKVEAELREQLDRLEHQEHFACAASGEAALAASGPIPRAEILLGIRLGAAHDRRRKALGRPGPFQA